MKNLSRLQMITEIEHQLNKHKASQLEPLIAIAKDTKDGFRRNKLSGGDMISRYTSITLYTDEAKVAISTFNEFQDLAEKFESLEISIHSGNYGQMGNSAYNGKEFYGINITNFELIYMD